MFVTLEDIQFPLPDTVEQAWDEIIYLRKDAHKMRKLAGDLAVARELEKRQYKANTQALGARIKHLQDLLKKHNIDPDETL